MEIKKFKTADEYNEFVNSTDGVLKAVKFFAPWCGPCRVLNDTIVSLDLSEEKVRFSEVNIDDDEFESIHMDLGVRSVPMMAYYLNGELKDKVVGLQTRDEIIRKVEELSK